MDNYIGQTFESSSATTPEFKQFAHDYKQYILRQLKQSDYQLVKFSRGHFYISGFLFNPTTKKYAYFSTSDVRYFPDAWYNNVLIRTATSAEDYTGGRNESTKLPDLIKNLINLTV
jgi:hypothetical protein